MVTIRFRETIPRDLVLLMPIPTRRVTLGTGSFTGRMRHGSRLRPSQWISRYARDATTGWSHFLADPPGQQILPHVFVEVRWEGHSATFPVRFDDKTRLPLLLVGRKPTEGELIEYFLFGKEPDEWDDGGGLPGEDSNGPATDAPIDTGRILAYFIRRFVQAIPGIEAEIRRAALLTCVARRGIARPDESAGIGGTCLRKPHAATRQAMNRRRPQPLSASS